MLLETLDIKKNDVLIYSENKFDCTINFKIIHKNSDSKKPEALAVTEVEKYINNPFPKNIILYRLLTNIPVFDSDVTKYGIRILIDNTFELMYYDPVFVIKELEELERKIDFSSFRFKIQQVGLSSHGVKNSINNFSEIYCFDLKAEEAKHQNDKIFAEAIFAFDNSFDVQRKPDPLRKPHPVEVNKSNLEVSEDVSFKGKNMNKVAIHIPQKTFIDRLAVQESKQFKKEPKLHQDIKLNDAENIPTYESIKSESVSNKAASVDIKYSPIDEFLKKQKQLDKVLPAANEQAHSRNSVLNLFKSVSGDPDYLKTRGSADHTLKADNK